MVSAEEGRSWHFRCCWNSKPKRLYLGTYPETSLKEAHTRRDEARELVARGIDPRKHRNQERRQPRQSVLPWLPMTGSGR
ncbi:DUF4102 domain-containing protein [Pseudomonas sp. BN417]|uniref:Arm DNA-binding domain-containing protein n=1 Tax=Pseudomonas sp. BN417 TaxID=2567890 RepID=UPI002454EBBC|nr:Arm DNA-binding domain-containing protein [Pseudomonas sp. BN417]MDH4558611.1 DUF4102 domain-containing protein [Pseudomonas sp. BN417]